MPCVSRFFGIAIYMNFNDHLPRPIFTPNMANRKPCTKSKPCVFTGVNCRAARTIW